MKRIPNWIKIVVILSLIVFSKFLFFNKIKEMTPPGIKNAKGGPIAVNYAIAQYQEGANRVFATGKLGALNQVEILPEITGKVTGIYFKEGEMVKQGTLLIKLNDADLQAQLSKTAIQLKLAEQKLDRLKKLLIINGVSEEEYEMQENEIAVLKADQAYTLAQIAKTSITAPFSGVIGLKHISEGSFVSPNTLLVSLVQMQPLFAEFSLPDKYAGLIKTGMKIDFTCENEIGTQSYIAAIYAIEPRVDEATKTIKVRALYSGTQQLYPGSFVKTYINLGERKRLLMLPTQCIVPILKGHKVFIAKNGLAIETPVEIGERNDQSVTVLRGLQEGDTVISSGLMSVKKDSKVVLLNPQK